MPEPIGLPKSRTGWRGVLVRQPAIQRGALKEIKRALLQFNVRAEIRVMPGGDAFIRVDDASVSKLPRDESGPLLPVSQREGSQWVGLPMAELTVRDLLGNWFSMRD